MASDNLSPDQFRDQWSVRHSRDRDVYEIPGHEAEDVGNCGKCTKAYQESMRYAPHYKAAAGKYRA